MNPETLQEDSRGPRLDCLDHILFEGSVWESKGSQVLESIVPP